MMIKPVAAWGLGSPGHAGLINHRGYRLRPVPAGVVVLLTAYCYAAAAAPAAAAAAAGRTVYEWAGPPATPTGEANSPLPSGPLLGNGDLGISVGCNKERTEVTLYLGLNQVWLLNEYQHWSDNSGDQVGPRRLGVGGITISAPEIANGNFSAELDMTLAEARVQLGPMSLRILLGERTPFTPSAYPTDHNGSSILVEINSSIPLTLNVTGWSLGLGTVCGRKVPHPHTTPCSTMDGATNAGATPEGILWTQ